MAKNRSGDNLDGVHDQNERQPQVYEDEKFPLNGDKDSNLSNYFVSEQEKGEAIVESANVAKANDPNSVDSHSSTLETGGDLSSRTDGENIVESQQTLHNDNSASSRENQERQSSGRSTQELEFDNERNDFSSRAQYGSPNSENNNEPPQETVNEQTRNSQLRENNKKDDKPSEQDDEIKAEETKTDENIGNDVEAAPEPEELTPQPDNAAPTSSDASIAIDEDSSHSFSVSDFQYEDADVDLLDHITITKLPVNGVLTLDGTPISEGAEIAATDIANLTFTPSENDSGQDYGSFKYSVNDGESDSLEQSFEIDVTGVADTPTLSVQSSGDIPVNIRISGDHYDPKNGEDVGAGSPQFQVFVNGEAIEVDGQKTFSVEAERGSWENFRVEVPSGTDISSIDVKFVNDAWEGRGDKDGDGVSGEDRNLIVDKLNIGGEANADGSYSGGVTIEAEDAFYDRPGSDGYETMPWSGTLSFDTSDVELGAVATGAEDTAISLNIQSGLTDSSETHTIQITDVPEGAELSAGINNDDGTWSLAPQDLEGLTITPPAEFSGSFELTVTAQSVDGTDIATATESFNIVVSDVNDGPVAVDDKVSGDEDSIISGNVLENDSDVDGKIQVENTGTFDTEHGLISVEADGSYEYTPAADYNGSDSFDVTIVDDDGATSTSTLNITINDDNVINVIQGDDSNNVLRGTSENDQIKGGEGNDRMSGGDGDDRLIGGDGNDNMSGGAGDDVLKGGDGNDRMSGGDGSDNLEFMANMGNDVVDGGAGGSWMDTIELNGFEGNGSEDGWTLQLDEGSVISTDEVSGEILLSQDSAGSITFDDGGSVTFENIENINW